MTPPKHQRGRPPKDPEATLQQRSVRLLPADWREFDLEGGQAWLRDYLAKRRAQRARQQRLAGKVAEGSSGAKGE